MLVDKAFNFATFIIEKASKLARKRFNEKLKKLSYKKGYFNLVTNVDHEVEKLILNELESKYPNHSIVAEESGIHKKNSDYQWFIDPIDGTTNFAHKYPFFCISIAFAKDRELQFGLVKDPFNGELFTARKI